MIYILDAAILSIKTKHKTRQNAFRPNENDKKFWQQNKKFIAINSSLGSSLVHRKTDFDIRTFVHNVK